jgi:cellulose biosynthesis protein BcsQ
MKTNVVNLEMSQQEVDDVERLLNELEARLSPLSELTIAERVRLVKMGRKNVDFVNRGYRHAEINREYLIGKIPFEDFKKDVDLGKWLRIVEKKMGLISSKVRDSAVLAEADAYRKARLYYNAAKAASRAGDELAEQIARDLSIHYRRKKAPQDEITPAPATQN